MLGEKALGEVDVADEEGGRLISSQCNYILGRETDCRRFWHISVWMPRYYSDHCALVTVIYAGGGGGIKVVPTAGAAISPLPPPWPP
jgi:hypothetical protein